MPEWQRSGHMVHRNRLGWSQVTRVNSWVFVRDLLQELETLATITACGNRQNSNTRTTAHMEVLFVRVVGNDLKERSVREHGA